jgi:hypothetical protein
MPVTTLDSQCGSRQLADAAEAVASRVAASKNEVHENRL